MQPYTFYKKFRASFLDNQRKKDAYIGSKKHDEKLKEDKMLSSSFEDAIILWMLDKIDPRLPAKIKKDYEHRLGNTTYLSDFHSSIFQAIHCMLDNMEKQARTGPTPTSMPSTPQCSRMVGGVGGDWGRGSTRVRGQGG